MAAAEPAPYVLRGRVAFHQADPAGVLFFGRYAEFWQSAYEGFVLDLGFDYGAWFGQAERSTPIRRIEVDHLAPAWAGEDVEVAVRVGDVGRSSFRLDMTLSAAGRPDDVRAAARITFVHTAAAADGRFAPAPLPDAVGEALRRRRVTG